MSADACELCGSPENLTRHHLCPRLKCKNKYKKIENDDSNILIVCEDCHRTIHAYFDENQLRDLYPSKDALLGNEKFAAFVEWKIRHPGKSSPSKMSNSRRRKR